MLDGETIFTHGTNGSVLRIMIAENVICWGFGGAICLTIIYLSEITIYFSIYY